MILDRIQDVGISLLDPSAEENAEVLPGSRASLFRYARSARADIAGAAP